ncbi:MAG TPA: NAD(P)H-dependent oxidoreductase subunit E [Candidatus Hydrogenedentes bacterium]|nr:NAD(P)H-dependent oxidoreductase subunit E [Candidatus Hydrogenedentota bacterium]HNT86962.1 NAD(P)H-dependent oxidoreductase subunit E [Candidatus Hydrogenedentota bacterium]
MAGDAALVTQVVEQFGRDRGRLMDIARALHAKLGCLTEDTIGDVADALGMRRVQVRDMVSFYAFFSRRPKGKTVIRLCDAVPERMKGAEEVARAFEEALGIKVGETTPDGAITIEHAPCIGLSDQAPGALIGATPVTNLTPADAPKIVQALQDGKDIATLPQAEVDLNLRKPGPVIFAPMERGTAIRAAVNRKPEEVIAEMNKSRLRGRGGAGFPTAMKWDFCRKAKGNARYLICNADEGEPGTFKDRVILTECPDLLFEGMTVAGYALGAKEGLLYLRGEYEYLLPHLDQVLAKRRHLGLLGKNIVGCEGFDFDIRIQLGAGAYICGEESALIESLEGKRGAPRDRPPFPVQKGYKNQPTSVNNVETLCCAARVLEMGGDWFAAMGTRDSTGTKLLSVSGDCKHPGVYELEYGITVEKLLEMVGAEDAQAVQVGGPSGQCVAPKDFGRSISFEDLPTGGSIIVFGPKRDLLECMRQFIEFFVEESCGWCVPCRVGTTILSKQLAKILDGRGTRADVQEMEKVANTVKTMSRCGLGQTAANPILSTLRSFPGLYEARLKKDDFVPPFDLKAALAEGCAITGKQPVLED